MNKKKLIIAVYAALAVLIIATAGLAVTVSALSSKKEGVICEGISVNGIAMGGKTKEETKKLLADYMNRLKKKELAVSITENGEVQGSEAISFKDMGVKIKNNDIVEEIVQIGEKGNIITRYKAIKAAKENKPDYKLEFKYDSKKIDKFVKDIAGKYNIAPEDANLRRVDGKFVITGGKTGRSLDIKEAAAAIKAEVENSINELPAKFSDETQVEFALNVKKPKYDKEALSVVTDLLGSYTTRFTPRGGRGQNVANGCRHINGSVVMPGETLSANKKMAPYTVQNGYGMGTAYVDGKVVPDMGGGICQVSSTLYNAVLFAELGVEQRQAHSLSVDYVELARDAAIAGTWKDFVFKNTTKYPVYVEGIINGGNITFNVYGHETRDVEHRKVELNSVILSRGNGGKAQLYKLIYENGVLKDRILVNTSTYRPHAHEEEEEEEEPEEEKQEKEEKEKNKKEEAKKKEKDSKKEEGIKKGKITKKEKIEKKVDSEIKNNDKPTPDTTDDEDEDEEDLEEGIEG